MIDISEQHKMFKNQCLAHARRCLSLTCRKLNAPNPQSTLEQLLKGPLTSQASGTKEVKKTNRFSEKYAPRPNNSSFRKPEMFKSNGSGDFNLADNRGINVRGKPGNNQRSNERLADRSTGNRNFGDKSLSDKSFGDKNTGNRFTDRYNNRTGNNFRRNGYSDEKERKLRPSTRFENKTGSAKAQEALKQIILKVYEANTGFKVNLRDEEGKLVSVHLLEVTNKLNLSEEGISVLNSHFDVNLPIIKKVPAKEMLQLYSDELAAQIEVKLLASGSAHAKKVVNNRLKVERKKSALKMVTLAWSISVSDLNVQKRKEIEKRIVAGEKFSIIIGDKSTKFRRRALLQEAEEETDVDEVNETQNSSGLNHLNDEEYELEIAKRERVFDSVELILANHRCKNSVSGSLEKQMTINVEPIKVVQQESATVVPNKEILTPKEARRLKRLEKAREAESGSSSVDPDAMYLFKIQE